LRKIIFEMDMSVFIASGPYQRKKKERFHEKVSAERLTRTALVEHDIGGEKELRQRRWRNRYLLIQITTCWGLAANRIGSFAGVEG
jgi:hypothetical protein